MTRLGDAPTRLTTPIRRQMRWPLPLALAVATVSPSIGNDLELQRVLQFLPYFVLGLCLRPEHFRLVRRWKVRPLAVPVFAVTLALVYWMTPRWNHAWLFHRDSVEELGVPRWYGHCPRPAGRCPNASRRCWLRRCATATVCWRRSRS
jgi:hypothetical protein